MFRFYVVPDATKLKSHSAIYSAENMKLFWDPRSESDAYAVVEAKGKAEINKAMSLEFSILPTNICYNDFAKKKSVVLAYDDDKLIFEGEVSTNPRDFYKRRKITCTDPLIYLAGSIQAPDEKNEVTVPEASSGTLYVKVPLVWYEGAHPYNLKWYERSTNSSGKFSYSRSDDTTANPDKTYYYKVTGSGENISGTTITKAAATKETIQEHISRILSVHNAQADDFRKIYLGTIDSSDSDKHEFSSTGWRTSWDAFNSDILEEYGKYTRITYAGDGTLQLDYLDIKNMSSAKPVIEYTRNMIEMTESTDNNDNIFTVLVPIGKNNLTVSSVTGHDSGGNNEIDPYIVKFGGEKRYVVVSEKAIAKYGYIVRTQTFSDVSKADELYDRAVKYIKNNYDYHTEYDVKAIDLKVLGETDHRITVGDKCRIKSTWHEVDEKDLYVISAQYDFINPENDSFKIGIPTSDREAGNRRLSGQSNNNKKTGSSNSSNSASSAGRLSSILESYIHVTEWGLEMNSRLKNEVESNDKKYITRFIQDENHINLAAEKLFGIDADGRGDKDAGYVRVPTSDYRDGDGPYKNPVNEHWFEKSGSDYVLSEDTTCDPDIVGSKRYYVQRLWSRYSDIDVGEGGIKARVDGNYETATYCSSWIQANEEQILALTGHLYVDEDGHVHVTSASGMMTDHEEERTSPIYVHVPTTMYANNPNPYSKHWYERVLDSSGAWIGNGKSDFNTNDAYYKFTKDRTVDRSKFYYYKTNIRETFSAQFGVYDEDNLTAGVLARTINNPTYHLVDRTIVEQLAQNGGSPKAQGWYEYNEATGTFGLTNDTKVPRDSTYGRPITNKYYTVTNNMQSFTDIFGEHIVVGKTAEYSGLNPATQARVNKYIEEHNLNGTITEIASDVVTVNALFAKYIEADDITANTSLWSDYIWGNHIVSHNEISASTHVVAPDFWIHSNPDHDAGENDSIKHGLLSVVISNGEDKNGTVKATNSGDDVTLTFYTLDQQAHSVTFTKPASLGTVTWSSGSNGGTLTAKTVGGRNFLVGTLGHYVPTSDKQAQEANSRPALTSYNTAYGLTYVKKGVQNNEDITETALLFKTPSKGEFQTYASYGGTTYTSGTITLEYATAVTVYGQRKMDGDEDYESAPGIQVRHAAIGVDGPTSFSPTPDDIQEYNNAATLTYGQAYSISGTYGGARVGTRKLFKAPTKGSFRTYANYGGTAHTSGTIKLDYGTSVTVYGQRKMDGDDNYESADGIQVRHGTIGVSGPSKFTAANPTEAIELNTATTLSYGQAYSISGTYGGTRVGTRVLFKTPVDNDATVSGRTYASYGDTEYTSGTINLGYSDNVTVRGQYKKNDGAWTNATGIKVTSPADNDATVTCGTYASYGGTEYTDSGIIELGYSSSVSVRGRYKKNDGNWTEAIGITVKAPASNSTTINLGDIVVGDFRASDTRPSFDYMFTTVASAFANAESYARQNGHGYVTFNVTVKGSKDVIKHYAIEFT